MRLINASVVCLVLLCGKLALCLDVQPVKGSDDSIQAIEEWPGPQLLSHRDRKLELSHAGESIGSTR